jgi:peptidoglycan hydrolase FlgJ
MQTSAVALSPNILKGPPATPEGATRERIGYVAKDFEQSFLSIMLGQMFQGVGGGEFSGGEGEAMFQSFLMDAISKQVVRSGGVGIADHVQREMLKLQGME